MDKEKAIKYGEIVAKCWENEEFKKGFIADPESVFKEYGIDVPEGIEYKVIEAPKLVEYFVLPAKDVKPAAQEMAKIFLQAAEKSDVILPEGTELRVIQNTEDVMYVILPSSPKTLTAAELARISGSGKTVQATEVVAHAVEATEAVTSVAHSVEAGVAAVAVCAAVLI